MELKPLSNDFYFHLQSLIYNADSDIDSIHQEIVSLLEKGSQNTFNYLSFLLSKTAKKQFWKIPSIYRLLLVIEKTFSIILNITDLLFHYKEYITQNQNGSFAEFCLTQCNDKDKQILEIIVLDQDQLMQADYLKSTVFFNGNSNTVIDLLYQFHSYKIINKFNIPPSKTSLDIALKCLTRSEYGEVNESDNFREFSRQSWFFECYSKLIIPFYYSTLNNANIILPTSLAKTILIYGPNLVRNEVRNDLFGIASPDSYNQLSSIANAIFSKGQIEFDLNLSENMILLVLNHIISSYLIYHPKEYEYVISLLKKISNRITDKIFHSLTDQARILKPMLVQIGCDFRTEQEKEYVFFPYDEDLQVHDREFIDYFHLNYPGFSEQEFSSFKNKIYDTRFCFGFEYSFYDDNLDQFKVFLQQNEKYKNSVFDVFYFEVHLIDVACLFGAEKIFNYLKNEEKMEISSPFLAYLGGNERIIQQCPIPKGSMKSFIGYMIRDRQYELAFRLMNENQLSSITIYNTDLMPYQEIIKNKDFQISDNFYVTDDEVLQSCWVDFLDSMKLEPYRPPKKKLKSLFL